MNRRNASTVSTHSNAASGLTAVEIAIATAIIAAIVAASMFYWRQRDRAHWNALAASGADFVFDLHCRVEREFYDVDEDVMFLCEIENVSPYPHEFSWEWAILLDGFRETPSLDWAVVDNVEELPSTYTSNVVNRFDTRGPRFTRTVFPDTPRLLRLRLQSQGKTMSDLAAVLRSPSTHSAKVMIGRGYAGGKNSIVAKPVTLTLNPVASPKEAE